MKRTIPSLIAAAVILLALSAASFLTPDRMFSDNENRYLQPAPTLTAERVLSGKFSAEAEKYESDQIAFRDVWMGAASTLQRLAGKRDIGGVYLGADGYYFARVTEEELDQANYEKNLRVVQSFFDAHSDLDCRMLLAPSPATVLSEKLPAGAPMYDAAPRFAQLRQTLGAGRVIDVAAALANTPEAFYRTDHHWTTVGAHSAYEVWCAETGHSVQNWAMTPVSETFLGTLYSKVLLPDSRRDRIDIVSRADVAQVVCDGEETDSLYRMDCLGQKDQYKVFFGGNWAQVDIDTGEENGRRLLVVKDSFANCFIPFLTRDYERITVLDLRFFNGSLTELLQQQEITDVLVLYEMSNFAADKNLFKLQEG